MLVVALFCCVITVRLTKLNKLLLTYLLTYLLSIYTSQHKQLDVRRLLFKYDCADIAITLSLQCVICMY